MKNISVSAHFECDICHAESANTSGLRPADWKEIIRVIYSDLGGAIKRRLVVGPACAVSTDPAILAAIRDLALRDC